MTSPDPLPPEPSPPPRRYPSTIGGMLYLLALLGVFVGLGIAALDDWRLGVRWVGAALVFAAGCRLVVPTAQAGMLAVRHRVFDATVLTVVGVVVILLAGDIPDRPPAP